MTTLKHAVEIEKPLEDVYALARQVDRYPEFLPGYLESRILDRRDGRLLLERKAIIQGRLFQWKSWVAFQTNKTIFFTQVEGPLKGMRVEWSFRALAERRTALTLTHVFHVTHPWGV